MATRTNKTAPKGSAGLLGQPTSQTSAPTYDERALKDWMKNYNAGHSGVQAMKGDVEYNPQTKQFQLNQAFKNYSTKGSEGSTSNPYKIDQQGNIMYPGGVKPSPSGNFVASGYRGMGPTPNGTYQSGGAVAPGSGSTSPSSGATMPGTGGVEPVSGGSNPSTPGAGSAGGIGGNFPGLNPSMFSQGGNTNFQNVYDQATGGTINAYNTAANRLRERVDSSTQAASDTARNRNLARGMGNSGKNDSDQFKIQQGGQQNYAQGLGDLENMFEQNRLQGLGIANQAAGGMSQNNNFMDRTLYDLMNNREQRSSAAAMQNSQNRFQGQQNQNQSELEQLLEQLRQQNQNYRNVQGGPSIYGSVNGSVY